MSAKKAKKSKAKKKVRGRDKYRVLRGITFPKSGAVHERVLKAGGRSAMTGEEWDALVKRDYKRAEPGEVRDDIPASCIDGYLRGAAIEKVEEED